MKEKLNFLSRLKISIFKVNQYSVFLRESLNKAIGYILILSILVGSIAGVAQFFLINTLEKNAKILLSQENFKFEMNNKLLDFKSGPYKEEEGPTVVIIDSNKTLEDSESFRSITVHKDMSSVFLKDGVVARANGVEYKIKYSDIPLLGNNINNEVAIDFLNKAKPIKYIIFITMILITYIIAMFNALIISLAGLMSSKLSGSKLKYKDIFKISIYSLSLPMIADVIIPIGNLSIIISAIYVVIVIRKIQKSNEEII